MSLLKVSLTRSIVFLALAASVTSALAQATVKNERLQAAALVVLGRLATDEESAALATDANATVGDYATHLQERLQQSPELRRTVTAKAFADAFGRKASTAEEAAWSSDARTYTERLREHLATLAHNPTEYAQVVDRAYQRYMRRAAYPGEHAYWQKQPTLSYALLLGCVEDWGRRNSPGLMETTGIPTVCNYSRFLTTVVLTPGTAAETRAAAAQSIEGDGTVAIAAGKNLIAPGGATIVTAGRMHLVAAGSSTLLVGD